MAISDHGHGVPENWFVDPVKLGVPGVRQPVDEDDNALAWQSDALCAQTDPEAFRDSSRTSSVSPSAQTTSPSASTCRLKICPQKSPSISPTPPMAQGAPGDRAHRNLPGFRERRFGHRSG